MTPVPIIQVEVVRPAVNVRVPVPVTGRSTILGAADTVLTTPNTPGVLNGEYAQRLFQHGETPDETNGATDATDYICLFDIAPIVPDPEWNSWQPDTTTLLWQGYRTDNHTRHMNVDSTLGWLWNVPPGTPHDQGFNHLPVDGVHEVPANGDYVSGLTDGLVWNPYEGDWDSTDARNHNVQGTNRCGLRLAYLAIKTLITATTGESVITTRPRTRIYPRDDGARIYPPPTSLQAPGRLTGYR